MACSIEHMPQSYPNQVAEGWDNYTQLLNEWLLLGCELISWYFRPALQAGGTIF